MKTVVYGYEVPDRTDFRRSLYACGTEKVDDEIANDYIRLIDERPTEYPTAAHSLGDLFDIPADLYVIWDDDSRTWKCGTCYDDLDVINDLDFHHSYKEQFADDTAVDSEYIEEYSDYNNRGQFQLYKFIRDDDKCILQYDLRQKTNKTNRLTVIADCAGPITNDTINTVEVFIDDYIIDMLNAGVFIGDTIVDVFITVSSENEIVDIEDQVF